MYVRQLVKPTSVFQAEIEQQPRVLERMLASQSRSSREIGKLLRGSDVRFLVIAARGSSQNAARYAQYVLGRASRAPVALATPSLYTVYAQPPRLDGALVIGISQSGRSPDVVSVLAEAKRQGRPTIAVTNSLSSPLAEVADSILFLEAGEEHAVAASKTYSNTVAAIAMLYSAIADDRRAWEELSRMPDIVAEQVERSMEDPTLLPARTGDPMTILGRGVNYSTAHEIALKIRELSSLFVEAYSPADLMHGPISALTAGATALIVAPAGPARASMIDIMTELQRRRVCVAIIGDRAQGFPEPTFPLVAGVPEWLSPLTAVVPGQVQAMRLAFALGKDIDRPAGLSKVTLTY